MRSGYGVIYFPSETATAQCGGVPDKPEALTAGAPLYSTRQLRPVLADNYRAGRVPEARYRRLMSWFEGAR